MLIRTDKSCTLTSTALTSRKERERLLLGIRISLGTDSRSNGGGYTDSIPNGDDGDDDDGPSPDDFFFSASVIVTLDGPQTDQFALALALSVRACGCSLSPHFARTARMEKMYTRAIFGFLPFLSRKSFVGYREGWLFRT